MSNSVPGWTEFLDGLKDLPERILARLPTTQQSDPQIRQEVARLALSAVTSAGIEALAGDPNHPVFNPLISNYFTTGQPNADTHYRSASIAPGGVYRLRGRRGSLNQAVIAERGPPPKQVEGSVNLGTTWPVHSINALNTDADGRYDVILSPARPEGYDGAWWQLNPATNVLLLRLVCLDWNTEIDATISIDRLDIPAARPRPPAAVLESALRAIVPTAFFMGPLLVDRVEKLRADGYLNKIRGADLTQLGGLIGQFYYEGAYELADDEALIIEAELPGHCPYRSIILTNDIYETTDWYNNHSCLNGAQAAPDSDGILRIVVSACDPGVPNWLDTAGFPTGVIQGRWTDCSSQPVPTVRKLLLAEVRSALPPATPSITPLQRDSLIRDRRAALQQRPLW